MYPHHVQSERIFNFLFDAGSACDSESLVLDISAGQLRYKPFFEHTHYLAIDSAIGDANWDFSGLDLIGDALALPIRTESVDVCLNFTSLEHYPDPGAFFSEVARVLKPGGKLFLYVPFHQGEHQIPHDYFRYTRYALLSFAEKNGLHVEQLYPTDGIFRVTLDMLNECQAYIPHADVRQVVLKFVNQMEQFFELYERQSSESLSVPYPSVPVLQQHPGAYCMVASKPGEVLLEGPSEDYLTLLNRVMACPIDKTPMRWDGLASYVLSEDGLKRYPVKSGKPCFLDLSGQLS